MYRIYINDTTILHNPMLADNGLVVINPVLQEAVNTHGSLQFSLPPTNPHYSDIEPRKTMVKVVSDTNNNKVWFGRVISVDRGWDNCKAVYCEGELGCLVDAVYQPFGFSGKPDVFFGRLMFYYLQQQMTSDGHHYDLRAGNVTVTDPNDYIVRSSQYPKSLWEIMSGSLFGSSLGGYIVPRYDKTTGTHYVDYLSDFPKTSTQTIKFGANLLNFAERVNTDNVITVLYPYGATLPDTDPNYAPDPPANGAWNGNRLTVESVNSGLRRIENADGIAMWGKIYGYKIWENATDAQHLFDKASAWLQEQIWQSVTLEISAVDLAFTDADIEQIQVGEYVRVQSKPHDLNVLLLCTQKTTYLTQLENSSIILGAGIKTITDLQKEEVAQN